VEPRCVSLVVIGDPRRLPILIFGRACIHSIGAGYQRQSGRGSLAVWVKIKVKLPTASFVML